ncbi:hypothetical protein BKA62DRAFT_753596 [Auriculariales sp. MPI-PUGE-AT-0066]|nr:hypothetical protein BKA62DRAFT_753596 [Auriculariales sp. MPI-PUGE-AT-0066]
MASFRTLLTYTQQAAALYADKPAFSSQRFSSTLLQNGKPSASQPSRRTLNERQATGRPFSTTLVSLVVPLLSGYAYEDTVHMFALSGSGYVPQAFSQKHAPTVNALLNANATRCLVYSPAMAGLALQLTELTPQLRLFEHPDLSTVRRSQRLQEPFCASGDDVFAIYHSSGSTGSLPKRIPYTYRFLDAALKKTDYCRKMLEGTRSTQTGTVTHIGQLSVLFGTIQSGSAIVIPYPGRVPYPAEDLVFLQANGLINTATFLAPLLGRYLVECRTDIALRKVFTQLRCIMYGGAALSESDLAFARNHGIRLMQFYATGELSSVMGSSGTDLLLRPIPGFNYSFVPLNTEGSADAAVVGPSPVYELVVPIGAPDLPHPSLLDADGTFHTKDLFREVQPGAWEFCGRTDDMIKMWYAGRCDTNSIVTDVLASCSDIVQTCFVAGAGRISPVLFVELQVDGDDVCRWERACEIVRRLEPSQALRLRHESIKDASRIVIVSRGVLPRTEKGNIRRAAVEEQYRAIMDAIDKKAT